MLSNAPARAAPTLGEPAMTMLTRWTAICATLFALAASTQAAAAVIYVDVAPDRVVNGFPFFFDVDGDGNRDILFDQTLGCLGPCQSRASVSAIGGEVLVASTLTDAAPLAAGAIIGPGALTFASGGLLAQDAYSGTPPVTFSESGLWDGGLTAFLGFRFTNATGLHYAWARLTVDDNTNIIIVRDAAYETTPGAAIAAGAVPEPAVMTLMVLGLGALSRRRRSRRT
jgi:hypothetical protein